MKMPKKRGFAILVILAVIATTSVVLATQLAAVENQSAIAVRAAEELKARDVAEACLDAADAYIEDFGLADTSRDFDELLDPDGNITTTSDNFLPPANLRAGTVGIANIPPGAADQFHQYRVFTVGTAGACFVRLDDNSDDSNDVPSLDQFTDPGEGTGLDLPQRDRDRTLSVTVVGVVPNRSVVTDLYPRAHAVATLTAIRSLPPAIVSGAAIEAGGTVDMDGAVCGSTAGVIADSIQGGLCVCGQVDAQLISGSLSGAGDCGCPDCAGNGGSNIGPGARANPVIVVPPFVSLLANVAFGAPGSIANNIGAGTYDTAVVLARDAEAANPLGGTYAAGGYQVAGSVDVFAWDIEDNDATTTLGAVVAAGAVTDCRDTSAIDPLPRACRWTQAVSTAQPTAVTCAAGESPCWKLVGRMGNGGHAANLDLTVFARAARNEQVNGGDFSPGGGALPNFKNATTWAGLAPGSCTACNTTASVLTNAGDNYTIATTAKSQTPHMVLAIETTTAGVVTLGQGEQSANFARLSVLAQSQVTIPASTRQCCATCDANCNLGGCSAGPPVPALNTIDHGLGFSVRTSGPCVAPNNNISMFGTLQCSQVDFDANNTCLVGGLIANATPGSIACNLPGTPNSAFCNANAAICFKNNPEIVGDVTAAGNICMKNNLEGAGVIQSQSNIAWKNNGVWNGQIRAAGDISAKNNAELTFNGSSGSSDAQGIAASFWIDGMW